MINNERESTIIDAEDKHTDQVAWNKLGTVKIPSEAEHKAKIQEKNNAPNKQKETIIHESLTRKAYEKKGIPFPYNLQEDQIDTFERQSKGNWTRVVTSITYFRDLEENEFLDWDETRNAKTDMKRNISVNAPHRGQYDDPVPSERLEFNPDTEENRLVTGERPTEINKVYHCAFSKSKLQELFDDCILRKCEFIISQEGARAYTVTKKELEKYAGVDFDILYNLKSDPNFKLDQNNSKK